jgi:hypothetical protein
MAELIVTPIEVVARSTNLLVTLAVIYPDAFAPDAEPKVLSMVMVPGNTMELVPIAPGLIAEPAERIK